MKKDDSIYLKHITDAIRRIWEYTSDVKYEEFSENHLVQDGVIAGLTSIDVDIQLSRRKCNVK